MTTTLSPSTPPVDFLVCSEQALLRLARETLTKAQQETDPAQRFATAYLAANRAGSAVLVRHGRPHRSRARPTSLWVLLSKMEPDLSFAASLFAAQSATRAAILAGIAVDVTQQSADALVHDAAEFIALVAGTPGRTLTPVIDCPECVWNSFGATDLDRDFVSLWSFALHAAGAEAVREHLIQAWRKRGYLAELVCHHAHVKRGEPAVPQEVLDAVAQEAVQEVSGEELLARADLEAEYAAWSER